MCELQLDTNGWVHEGGAVIGVQIKYALDVLFIQGGAITYDISIVPRSTDAGKLLVCDQIFCSPMNEHHINDLQPIVTEKPGCDIPDAFHDRPLFARSPSP